jgi:hypothetical protein
LSPAAGLFGDRPCIVAFPYFKQANREVGPCLLTFVRKPSYLCQEAGPDPIFKTSCPY